MITSLAEIGVAVRDGAKSGQELIHLLGAKPGAVLESSEYGMRAWMVKVGDVEFEYMEPSDARGLIAGFLQKRGEGLHHLAFRVDDIVETLESLKRKRFPPINAEPISVLGCKAAFLHPAGFCGVLVELIEGTAEPSGSQTSISGRMAETPVSGVGAVEILAVGIFVDSAAAAAEIYADALEIEKREIFFASEFGEPIAVLQVGGVDLVLMQMPPADKGAGVPFSGQRVGLHHVVIRVEALDRARAFLESRKIDFHPGLGGSGISSKSLLMKPSATNKMTLVLQEGAAAWPRLAKQRRVSGYRGSAGETG